MTTARTVPFLLLTLVAAACATSSSESFSRDPMLDVGNYPPPPPGAAKPRTGVVAFADRTAPSRGHSTVPLGLQASEQFETLAMKAGRFRLIERQQLEQLLREQGLAGVVQASELPASGRIRGIDFMVLGAITNFEVKVEHKKLGGGVLDALLGHVAPVDINSKETIISTRVGVDIKLVDSTTGEIVAKDFGEVQRQTSVGAWGLRILGVGGDGHSDVQIDTDAQGRILRWALDETMRKLLPAVDQYLVGWTPPERDATAPGDPVFAGGTAAAVSDYFEPHFLLAQHIGDRWVPTQQTSEAVDGAAMFRDVRSNAEFRSKAFSRTRPATAADLQPGATVFVLWDTYSTPNQAKARWRDQVFHWERATVSGTRALAAQGIVSVGAFGGAKDVHVSNLRVPVEQ